MLKRALLLVLAATACADGARDEDAGRRHELPRVTGDRDAGDPEDGAAAGGVAGLQPRTDNPGLHPRLELGLVARLLPRALGHASCIRREGQPESAVGT